MGREQSCFTTGMIAAQDAGLEIVPFSRQPSAQRDVGRHNGRAIAKHNAPRRDRSTRGGPPWQRNAADYAAPGREIATGEPRG